MLGQDMFNEVFPPGLLLYTRSHLPSIEKSYDNSEATILC